MVDFKNRKWIRRRLLVFRAWLSSGLEAPISLIGEVVEELLAIAFVGFADS